MGRLFVVILNAMKGRMPFPIPFLPMVIVAVMASWVGSKLLHSCGQERARELQKQIHSRKDTLQDETLMADPFSDDPEQRVRAAEAAPVRITTKHVEIGSGAEELKFDWILEPGKVGAEKGK